tara:strand:- start:1000 stop:1221 length:222 start_codon:yes stop_codon:yes gene_type:complete
MVFTENKEFNSLTPEDIYTVSKEVKDLLNKVLNGGLSSIAFVRKDEENNYQIKPATHRDKKLLLQIFNKITKK